MKTILLDEVQPTTTTVEVKDILVAKLTVSKFLHLLFNPVFVRNISFNNIVLYFKELLFFLRLWEVSSVYFKMTLVADELIIIIIIIFDI